MNRIRTGLLAAIAVIALPAIAHAQDREERRRERADGERTWQHPDRPAPAPLAQPARPQLAPPVAPPMQASRGMPGVPASDPGRGFAFGRQGTPVPGDRRPQWQGDRGNWGGGNWSRGDGRPVAPQAGSQSQNWQDRGQRRRQDRADNPQVQVDRGHDNDRRWEGGNRTWGNDNRHWNNDNRRWNNDDRRGDDDRRWNRDGRRWSGDDRQWDNRNRQDYGRSYWLNPGWHNDRRYDWRGWRDSHRDLFRWRYSAPRGYHYRPVWRGFFLEPFFYGSSYWLADPYEYRLPPVQWPLRWVRYYNDALLVDVTTGEVMDVVQDFFW